MKIRKSRSTGPQLLLPLFLPLLALAVACGGGDGGDAGNPATGGKVGRRPAPGGGSPAEAVERGEMLYSRSGCAVCHGPEGRGDGLGAAGLVTKPRDFSQPAAFRSERTVEALAKTIAQGSADGSMPPYNYLGDRDRQDLAAFVLSLAK